MRISEMVEKLLKIKEKYSDLECNVPDPDEFSKGYVKGVPASIILEMDDEGNPGDFKVKNLLFADKITAEAFDDGEEPIEDSNESLRPF